MIIIIIIYTSSHALCIYLGCIETRSGTQMDSIVDIQSDIWVNKFSDKTSGNSLKTLYLDKQTEKKAEHSEDDSRVDFSACNTIGLSSFIFLMRIRSILFELLNRNCAFMFRFYMQALSWRRRRRRKMHNENDIAFCQINQLFYCDIGHLTWYFADRL